MRLTTLDQLVLGKQRVDGVWRLTPSHELQYRRRPGEKEIVLKGKLVEAQANGLSFRASELTTEEEVVWRTLTLRGRWEADPENRLSFLVERGNGKTDRLTLEGAWTLNESQEILYRFQQSGNGSGSEEVGLLRFQGYWDIAEGKRLTYVLDQKSDSAFRFRGAFQTPSILSKRGAIHYQIGIELEGKRELRTVTLFGQWKLSRDLSLSFEIPSRDGSVRGIHFKAVYAINDQNTLSGQLMTKEGEPLGIELIVTREFLKGNGQAFARLRRSLEETAVEGGMRFKW